MTFERIFKDAERYALNSHLSKIHEDYAFQFNITGEGEGKFYIAKKNGEFSVRPFDYKDNTASLTGGFDAILKIIEGKISLERAVEANLIKVSDGPEKGNGYFKASRIFSLNYYENDLPTSNFISGKNEISSNFYQRSTNPFF